MIDIIIYKSNGMVTGYRVSGHAKADEYGKDIVCASVSVLAINTANSLESFTKDVITSTVDASGLIDLKIDKPLSEVSQILLKSFELGIQDIYDNYSSYINLESKEV